MVEPGHAGDACSNQAGPNASQHLVTTQERKHFVEKHLQVLITEMQMQCEEIEHRVVWEKKTLSENQVENLIECAKLISQTINYATNNVTRVDVNVEVLY